jgi:glycosyltransferase involved in cell wall biosynthesis
MSTKKIRIGIIGSRGIPNYYGGFEQFAAYLAPGLVEKGFEVFVYCPHHHPWKEKTYRGVQLIRCLDPEPFMGGTGQFVYDLNCILDSHSRNFDVLYQLGYTTNGIWQRLMPKNTVLVSNMDGLEWSRAKYGSLVKKFLHLSEKMVVRRSDFLIADGIPIQQYLLDTYGVEATYLAYGADLFDDPNPEKLQAFRLLPQEYMLVIARMQPDNHIETIIQAVLMSGSNTPLMVVGTTANKYGAAWKKKYQSPNIRFLGGIFDPELLDNLRHHAALYFHGHSAGGTNPSLLEAMAASARICAHDNRFNRSVLGEGALYFQDCESLALIIAQKKNDAVWEARVQFNRNNIQEKYKKSRIIEQYHQYFNGIAPTTGAHNSQQ